MLLAQRGWKRSSSTWRHVAPTRRHRQRQKNGNGRRLLTAVVAVAKKEGKRGGSQWLLWRKERTRVRVRVASARTYGRAVMGSWKAVADWACLGRVGGGGW